MLGRKRKKAVGPTAGRHARIAPSGTPKPFSYYGVRPAQAGSRPADTPVRPRIAETAAPTNQKKHRAVRPFRAVLWVFGLLLCMRLLYLQTAPEVQIVSDSLQVAASAESAYRADAQKVLSGSVFNRFKLTLDTKGVAAGLQAKHPEIRYAHVSAPVFGSTPRVSLTLMNPVGILQSAGATYGLDATGHTLAASEGSPELPLIIDEASVVPVPGERFLPASTVKAVTVIVEQVSAAGMEVTTVTLPKANPYELAVRLRDKPFTIRFNLEADMMQQSGAAIATIKHLGEAQPKEYMDVRVLGRVYYK